MSETTVPEEATLPKKVTTNTRRRLLKGAAVAGGSVAAGIVTANAGVDTQHSRNDLLAKSSRGLITPK